MATFETIPKIKVRAEGLTPVLLDEFCATFDQGAQWLNFGTCRCVALFDVDLAEKAVAWLKEHGVEQEPKAPKRDTAKVIGNCRVCGETDTRRKNGRCNGVPGSTHDWPENPSVYERCKRADAIGAKEGTCKRSNLDCGAHEFRGVFG